MRKTHLELLSMRRRLLCLCADALLKVIKADRNDRHQAILSPSVL
jgi:hypothetical protein